MLAYLVRRLLLFVPTLFGIMVVNFIVVQAAPGGPVELMISRLRGHAVEATARVGGSGGGETRAGPSGPGRRRDRQVPRRPRHRSGADPPARAPVRLRPPRPRAVRAHDPELPRARLRHELLPGSPRHRPDRREAAGVDLARPVDDAAHLPRVDPARHRQGRARRLDVRRLDERRRHRRLRDPQLSLRDPADRPVRRRQLPRLVPAPRAHVRPLAGARLGRPASATTSGTSRCRSSRSSSAGSPR